MTSSSLRVDQSSETCLNMKAYYYDEIVVKYIDSSARIEKQRGCVPSMTVDR